MAAILRNFYPYSQIFSTLSESAGSRSKLIASLFNALPFFIIKRQINFKLVWLGPWGLGRRKKELVMKILYWCIGKAPWDILPVKSALVMSFCCCLLLELRHIVVTGSGSESLVSPSPDTFDHEASVSRKEQLKHIMLQIIQSSNPFFSVSPYISPLTF